MESNKIISDLRRLGGSQWLENTQKISQFVETKKQSTEIKPVKPVKKIELARIKLPKKIDKPITTPVVINIKPAIDSITHKDMSIDDVIAMIKDDGFVVVKQDGKSSVDNSTMMIKCNIGHIHRYFISDITKLDGDIKCITCKLGNKFDKLVRETAEELFGFPFILHENSLFHDLRCAEVKIRLLCSKGNNILMIEDDLKDNYLSIVIEKTASAKKVGKILTDLVVSNKQHFNGSVLEKINTLVNPPVEPKPRKAFVKNPLPYTREMVPGVLADWNITNDILGTMNMNIVAGDDANMLCIEKVSINANRGLI